MTGSFSQWYEAQHPPADSFNIASQGGPQPFWRDYNDFRRSGWRSTPEAQYPDGYLGTIYTRRNDRLLDGLKQRQAQRPAQRGIHKGDRIDSRDYFWLPEFNPMSGLETEAAGLRYVPPGLGGEWTGAPLVNNGRGRGPRGAPGDGDAPVPAPVRSDSLRRLAPPYGTPGMAVAPIRA